MIPIPRRLLIHSCTLKEPESEDEYSSVTYSEPITLSHVRIEPSAAFAFDKQNRQIQLSAVLIYDCRSSSGMTEFKTEQVINFGEFEYTVVRINCLYDERQRPHHYELGLC